MYVHQIESVQTSWNDANGCYEKLQRRATELSTIVSKHDAHLEKHRWETRRAGRRAGKAARNDARCSEEFEKCEGHGEVLKERKKKYVSEPSAAKHASLMQEQRKLDKEADLSEGNVEKIIQIGAALSSANEEDAITWH